MIESGQTTLLTATEQPWRWPRGTRESEGQAPALDSAPATLLDVSRFITALLRLTDRPIGERGERITALVKIVLKQLDLERPWEFEVAARLSQIGCLALPPALVDADSRGEKLSDEDLCTVASHPLIARDLLGEVGRLDGVAEMVARQREPVSGPEDIGEPLSSHDRLQVGGQLLRVCGELDRLVWRGMPVHDALAALRAHPREFHPEIVAALATVLARTAASVKSSS
jgi:response regulator RpfG family c-di-GMP phosphodiesterase